jgi:hypothetical protein
VTIPFVLDEDHVEWLAQILPGERLQEASFGAPRSLSVLLAIRNDDHAHGLDRARPALHEHPAEQ